MLLFVWFSFYLFLFNEELKEQHRRIEKLNSTAHILFINKGINFDLKNFFLMVPLSSHIIFMGNSHILISLIVDGYDDDDDDDVPLECYITHSSTSAVHRRFLQVE